MRLLVLAALALCAYGQDAGESTSVPGGFTASIAG